MYYLFKKLPKLIITLTINKMNCKLISRLCHGATITLMLWHKGANYCIFYLKAITILINDHKLLNYLLPARFIE